VSGDDAASDESRGLSSIRRGLGRFLDRRNAHRRQDDYGKCANQHPAALCSRRFHCAVRPSDAIRDGETGRFHRTSHYRGADGKFTLYEDERDSYDYERGAYATIPFAWNEAKQTLTMGKRSGEFPGMLKERTFHVIFVSPDHGAGMAAEEKADAAVHYTGKAVTVISKK